MIHKWLVGLVGITLVGCATVAPKAPERAEWTIPFLNSLSGQIASIGEYMEWGAERAAQEINAAGGISGKPVRIVRIDAVDAQNGSVEMARLVKADTLVALGPVSLDVIVAAMPIAVEAGMPSITASTSLENARKFFPWTISWFPSTQDRLAPLVDAWAKQFTDVRQVVQFVENNSQWRIMADAHAAGLSRMGIKVLDEIEVPKDSVPSRTLVANALKEEPDGMIFACNPTSAALLIAELRRSGWTKMDHLLIFSGADSPDLYRQGGQDLNGAEIYGYVDPSLNTPRWNAYAQAYSESHGGQLPPFLSTDYYDAVYMVKEAMEKTGITGLPERVKAERKMIADYISNVKGFHGIMFDWDMKDGIPTNKPAFIFKIQDGAKILLQEVRAEE